MATVLITFKIMPDSVEANLDTIEQQSTEFIEKFGGKVIKNEREPIAFGLVALKLSFSSDEQNSNLDPLEDQIRNVEGVSSVEVVDIRRAIG